MKKIIFSLFIVYLLIPSAVFAVQDTIATEQLKVLKVPLEAEKGKLYFLNYEELGWVKQGATKGYWRDLTTFVSYSLNDLLLPYLEVNAWDRFGSLDQTIDLGTYLRFKDKSYLRIAAGGSPSRNYLYRFQGSIEYQHKLVNNYYWDMGLKYLNYPENNDVYIFSPGLKYYFGDNFVNVFYNASATESRGVAQWGIVKGNFAVNKRLNVWLGTAIGERLYDILPVKASKEYGYIYFTGADINVYKDFNLRLGFSYSKEVPSFIKRSLEVGGSVKF
jgi:YaiO family outer membrane protein